jgi:hypothetical protein
LLEEFALARYLLSIVIRIKPSDREADRLEQAFLQTTDRKFRDRLQISSWPTGAAPIRTSPPTWR